MPFPGKQEDPNDPFDPLGDDGMDGDEYQGCGDPWCGVLYPSCEGEDSEDEDNEDDD